ncbi:leucine-rich repeat-containing protein 34 isoform X1 [Lepisosteus oculatus]|uniref:leucine-rich repeat-containing protein 34 isoform X1 n=1 Tax=Lepisosteus oculatus TaxID=7918 RepID=UPI0035F52790
MSSIRDRYSAVCSESELPTNPYILHVLHDTDERVSRLSPEEGVEIKLTGNNRLLPVQRLSDTDVLALSKALADNVSVRGLDLRYNSITDEGAAHLGVLLQENASLRCLNLMGNDIEVSGAEFIAKALHRNETLKTLQMTGNKIGDKGGMHFAAMLQINSSLEELDLGDCDLDTQSLIAFAIVLNHNKNAHVINLSRPLLFSQQEETTVHMARMLKVNRHLRELHLGKHEMKDFGVERLCDALSFNSTLRYLDLRCNSITRDGAKCLAELLKQNTGLEILDLASNRIEDDGAVYVSEALAMYNNTLKALSIPSNNIGARGLVSLAKALKVNTTLSHIYIWGNILEAPACLAFSKLIESGRLSEEDTDVSPYEVEGRVCLSELFHGLRRHYYWTPSYRQDGDPASNSSLALRDTAKEGVPSSFI